MRLKTDKKYFKTLQIEIAHSVEPTVISGGMEVRGSIPCSGIIFLFATASRSAVCPTISYPVGNGCSFPGDKVAGT
jgi:hypothetical protein